MACFINLFSVSLRGFIMLLFVVAVGYCVSASGGGKEKEKINLSLEWFWNPDHLPFLIAESEGFFNEGGIEVNVIEPSDHFEPVGELQTDSLDVAVTETVHLAQDRAKIDGESTIVGFNRFFNTIGGVMYRKDKGIIRPKDMCKKGGKLRIQYPGAPGLGGKAIIRSLAEADGGDCSETEFIPHNEGFFHTKALFEDKADVATLIFVNFEIPEATSKNLDVGYFDLKEYGVPDFCQLILISTPEKLKKKAIAFRSLNKALLKANDFLKLHPEKAKQIWYNKFPAKDITEKALMDDILQRTLPMFPVSFDLSSSYWKNMENWLLKTKQIESTSNLDYWSNVLLFDGLDINTIQNDADVNSQKDEL